MNTNSWALFEASHIAGGIKRRIKRVATAVMPSYRAISFIKEQNAELKAQNELLFEEIRDIKKNHLIK